MQPTSVLHRKTTIGLISPLNKEISSKLYAMNTLDELVYALNRAATKFAQTLPQRNAFKVYWLQRLHVTNTRGVADVIIQRLPFDDQVFSSYTAPDSLPHMAQTNPHPIAFPLPQMAQQASVFSPFVSPFSPDTTHEIPLRDASYFN